MLGIEDAAIGFGLLLFLLFIGLLSNRSLLRWWYFKSRREHPSNYLKVLPFLRWHQKTHLAP